MAFTREEIQQKLNIKSRSTFAKFVKQGKIMMITPLVPEYEIVDEELLKRIKNPYKIGGKFNIIQ